MNTGRVEKSDLPFSIMPVEAFFDGRLTLTDIRVLGAILSFRGRDTNVVFPSRSAIAARCGVAESRISSTTTHLVELGWMRKVGKGGKSSPCHYEMTVPGDLTDMVRNEIQAHKDKQTVTELVTVTESVTVTELVTRTVTESVTGKEETKEETKEEDSLRSSSSIADHGAIDETKPSKGKRKRKEPPEPSKGAATWEAYRIAYEIRYGVTPIRNAKVNAQISALVDRVGSDLAPQVAEMYVGIEGFYAQRSHPIDLMVSNAETLGAQCQAWLANGKQRLPAGTTAPGFQQARNGYAQDQRFDNSAPGKVARAIAERDERRRREAAGAGGASGFGDSIDGEYQRIPY